MAVISFNWTAPALLAGHKTVTRREWKESYARQFQAGDVVAAYDRQPRFGGRRVATIRLTQKPYRENTREAPEEDYEQEGLAYLQQLGAKVDGLSPEALWRAWHVFPRVLWVVRFELIEVL